METRLEIVTAPAVTTNAASEITINGATLNGAVNPNGLATTAQFEYGLTSSYSSTVPVTLSPDNGNAAQTVSAVLTKLTPQTTYHYRITSANGIGSGNGADQTFTTAGAAPTVTLAAATGVTATTVTLNGSVNPNFLVTTAQFEYGATTSYGSLAPVTLSPDNGSTAQTVSAALMGLHPGLTYHYRLSATNVLGTRTTTDGTLTPPGTAPSITPNPVAARSVTLTGTVNPNGFTTTLQFEYDLTSSYGNTLAVSAVSGTGGQAMSAAISGLQPLTTYHCRLMGSNSQETANGADLAFSTPYGPPLPGDFDAGFGTNGRVITSFGSIYDFEYGMTLQQDGKIVVAGSTVNGGQEEDFVVVRYNLTAPRT